MTNPNGDWGHAGEIEDISGQVAIVGVGDAIYRRASGSSAREIAFEAIQRALDDAGLEPDEIDGLMQSQAIGDPISSVASRRTNTARWAVLPTAIKLDWTCWRAVLLRFRACPTRRPCRDPMAPRPRASLLRATRSTLWSAFTTSFELAAFVDCSESRIRFSSTDLLATSFLIGPIYRSARSNRHSR